MRKITKRSKRPSSLTMMPNRPWSGSWSAFSQSACGGCGAPRQWKPACSNQADHLSAFRQARQVNPASREVVDALIGRADPTVSSGLHCAASQTPRKPCPTRAKSVGPAVDRTADLAQCFLRLANLPNYALDRLSRYEATLWRQAGRILFALDALDRRKPQERGRRFPYR